MARYKKVIKRKEEQEDLLLSMQPQTAMEWVTKYGPRVAAAAAVLILAISTVYGYRYWDESVRLDAAEKLYRASSLAPATGASREQADQAVTELEKVVASSGPEPIRAQAALQIARLKERSGDHDGAMAAYSKASSLAGKGSLAHELSLVGAAHLLIKNGHAAEAIPPLRELSEEAQSYPRAEALFTLAFSYAAAGDKDAAIGSLNKIKADYPDYLPQGQFDDLVRRIDTDQLAKVFAETEAKPPAVTQEAPASTPAVKVAPSPAPGGGKIGIHTGATAN